MDSRLNPYIGFTDNARPAMEFYQSVFGGTLVMNTFGEYGTEGEDADKIMHAQLETDKGYTLMGADTIAGFLFEPITGAAGGCLIPPDDYWRDVTEICRRHGILMIADEVMTGFGRTGTRWGFQHFPVEPDILYGGKGLGGGYVPMGMVAATDEIVDALRGSGFMFFTFTGADAMCAGAAAVLDVIDREHLVERSAAMGDVLADRLDAALAGHPAVVEMRGRGMFRGVELRSSGGALVASVVRECMARDLWVYPAGSGVPPVTDAVMIGAPLTISEPEVDELVDRLAAAIDAAAAHA